MSGRVYGNSVQAGRIDSLHIGPQPPPWRNLLVVAVVALLLGAAGVVVAISLDNAAEARSPISPPGSNSSSVGISTTPESVPETTEETTTTPRRIPTTTTTTSPAVEYKVEGPVLVGEVELRSQNSYDLDRDQQAFSDEGGDVILDCCALHTFSGRELTFPGGDQPADCLGQPTRRNVVVEKLQEHPTLCVVTEQGRLATVHATLVSGPLESNPRVKITYELWSVSR